MIDIELQLLAILISVLFLETTNLAWIILGLHVDLRCRVGQVETERGREGGGEGRCLLLLLLIQALR